jgi:hypothetical protein
MQQWDSSAGRSVLSLVWLGASSTSVWWKGDAGQVAWFIYRYESLRMPASLLEDGSQERLAQGSQRNLVGVGVVLSPDTPKHDNSPRHLWRNKQRK